MPQRKDSLGGLYCFPEADGATQVVSYTATAAQSAALNAQTAVITLTSTSDAWVMIGTNPTAVLATAGAFFIPAKYPMQFCVIKGTSLKVSAVQDTAGGKLSIIEST